jgi:hypothetical protein
MTVIKRKEPWWSIQLHSSTDETLRDMYADGRITLAEYEAEVDRRLGVGSQLRGAVAENERLRSWLGVIANTTHDHTAKMDAESALSGLVPPTDAYGGQ